MRGNEFLDKMELVDPVYVEEADQQPPKTHSRWLKWGGLAACLCVVAAASVFALTAPDDGPRCVEPVPAPNVTSPYDGPTADILIKAPEAPTSETYSTLTELLDYLRLHDGHSSAESNDGYRGGFSMARAAMEGSDTVSWKGTVYQINYDTAKWVGVYQNGLLTGTLDAPADYLFVSDGRLVAVGAEYYSGDELDPVHCVRVNIFDLNDPAHPEKLDTFTQLGDLTACWMNDSTLYLMTDDGVCACGYSRFSNLEDYKPQLFHGEEQIPWFDEDILILGTPSRVSYAAVSCIDAEILDVTRKRAFYGDIENVYFGEDWLALVTAPVLEFSYTLQDVYTFDGLLTCTGKCDMAEVFGLEKTQEWSEDQEPPRSTQRPDIKAVTKADGFWRIVGECTQTAGPTWWRDLFVMTFDPETNGTVREILSLPEDQFSIDDVLWEENRAIISAGFTLFGLGPDDVTRGARLAFAEFDGMDITLLSSDIICDRVTGIETMYSYGSPLGNIRPFIPLATGWGSGWYLRYNEIPNGFDIYDLSDSQNPVCLYKSQGDIPEGCRLDFDHCVLYSNGAASAVAVKLITPKDGDYRHPDYSWCIFYVDEEPPVTLRVSSEQYPATGFDPISLASSDP